MVGEWRLGGRYRCRQDRFIGCANLIFTWLDRVTLSLQLVRLIEGMGSMKRSRVYALRLFSSGGLDIGKLLLQTLLLLGEVFVCGQKLSIELWSALEPLGSEQVYRFLVVQLPYAGRGVLVPTPPKPS